MDVSIVVPIYNEQDNIDRLCQEISAAMTPTGLNYQVVMVDDGSKDRSVELIQEKAASDSTICLVQLRRNYGQTAAMQAGIDFAEGEVLVTLDGDLQNDPADIPMMLEKIQEGYDLVHGWRKDRKDAWLSRKLPSKIANWIISKTTKFPIHDLGCTLKAIRRSIAKELNLYGEMHRFIPIIAHQRGAKCCEVVTNHRPRLFGETKYGIDRTFRVVLDLITVWYMQRFFASPMKLFGLAGMLSASLSAVCLLATAGMKIFGGVDITGNPMFLLWAITGIGSIQFFSLGLMGEIGTRTYYKAAGLEHYSVRNTVGFQTNTTDKCNLKIHLPSKAA